MKWIDGAASFPLIHRLLLKGVDLPLSYLGEEVAPVAARDEKIENLQLRVHTWTSLNDVGVERVVRQEPDTREAVLGLPRQLF